MPKSNVAFWMAKWSRNVRRDKRHEAEWRKLGWNVIVVWECALDAIRREDTLVRICQALDFWKGEGPGKRPHRLTLPRLSPRRYSIRRILPPAP